MPADDPTEKPTAAAPAPDPDGAAGALPPAGDNAGPGRGRAKQGTSGSAGRQRTKRIIFRALPKEATAITRLAEAAHMPVGAYCRAMALTGQPPRNPRVSQVDREALTRLLGQLGRVGNNLNQVARSLNNGRPAIQEEVCTTIAAVRAAVAEVMTALGRKPTQ